ncbi:rRNA pseudouridine synthase [Cerasibacillus terrae]|uniref:Pseudouridine synthase n=1 Tax=Cerasibacillus terrae TaxID=2498845 RepID=A0A5C8NFA5_9BACI|nr:pseudouridine synthase [Cerasibacillus terrae]TXL60574.1 rRNA pseudouridine synthase [Cerasibacillus terrae]
MRLDKLLANVGIYGSRKDVKKILKKGKVMVNGARVKAGSIHVDPEVDEIDVNGELVTYREFIYLMLNKPPGYISATEDDIHETVIDLLAEPLQYSKPFPVGRLDKDTEGLLLLTNDGKLAHRLLSPKQGIEKEYYAKVRGVVDDKDVNSFQNGVLLDDGYMTKEAQLHILSQDEISEVKVTITEGKFHQVKRMFQAVGKEVVYLKRIRMGEIILDSSLSLGDYRELTNQEMAYCKSLFLSNK